MENNQHGSMLNFVTCHVSLEEGKDIRTRLTVHTIANDIVEATSVSTSTWMRQHVPPKHQALDTRPHGDNNIHNIKCMENVDWTYYTNQDYNSLYTKLSLCLHKNLKCSADKWLVVPVQIFSLSDYKKQRGAIKSNRTKPAKAYC